MKAKRVFSRFAIAVLTLCMMFGTLFAFAACNDGTTPDGDVNIVLSATTATVQVGKTFRLTGTLELDGAKITWSSEDESIATVSATGVIKGVKVGKTNIKATYENISATCEVTVIDEVTVSLNKTELALNVGAEETLTATASNGGTVAWSSSDASVAKVEGGKVTALKEGTAYIYAECDGTRATCEVTVTDPSRKKITKCAFDDITELDTMFYFDVDGATASVDDMYYSVADQTYHAKFDNSGWAWYGFQLFFIKSDIEGSNNTMSFTLNSSAAGHITVNGTPITLVVGDNDISLDNNTGSLSMQFGLDNGQNANDITGTVTITISKLTFTPYTPEKLTAPTAFTLDAQNKKITVTDTANDGHAQSYRVVFYQDNEKKGEAVLDKDGKFDDGKIPDGEYTLKVYAYSTGKYTSSDEFGPDPAVTYTVANGGIQYDLTFKAEADIDDGTWYYWKDASTVTAKFQGGKLNVEFTNNTGNWYATQLFYLDPVADKSRPNNKITFTLKSNKAGHISVNGNIIEIKEADIDKEVEYSVYNLGSGKATVSIQMGVNGSGIDISDANMTFTFEDPMVSTFEPQKLATPSIAFGENYAYTITDETNEAGTVTGYDIALYNGDKLVTTVKATEKTGTLDISKIVSGTYTAKVIAVGTGRYQSSDASDGVSVDIVNAEGVKYDMATDKGAADAEKDPGTWYVWAGLWDWTSGASNATVTSAKYDNGTITLTFKLEGGANGNAWGLQINYVNPDYEAGTQYSFDIVSTADINIQVESGSSDAISVTANESKHITGGSDGSFYLQVNVGANGVVEATITITNVKWEAPDQGGEGGGEVTPEPEETDTPAA